MKALGDAAGKLSMYGGIGSAPDSADAFDPERPFCETSKTEIAGPFTVRESWPSHNFRMLRRNTQSIQISDFFKNLG